MLRMSKRRAVGIAKTAALFVILAALAVTLAYVDGVADEDGGDLLGFVYGSIAGYGAIITGIVRDWITP